MAVTPACVAAVKTASGDTLSDAEAADLIRYMEGKRRAFEARGEVDQLDARLRAAAAEDATRARIAAALARKHAAMAAIAYDRALADVTALRAGGLTYRKALLAFLEGSARALDGARASVAATALAFRARYLEGFNLAMVRDAETARLVQNGNATFAAEVVREMRELRDGGQPGRTGNGKAAALAKLYAELSEKARVDLNRLGAPIGRLDGWSPQAHDSMRVMRASFEEWRDFILPRLDLERTFGEDAPAATIESALRDIHRAIITGVDRRALNAQPAERLGPANLANSLASARALHFADADAWLAYSERFGAGNIHDAMLAHLTAASKAAGQLQRLGPNPEATLTRLRGAMMRQAALDPKLTPAERQRAVAALDPSNTQGTIGSAWAEVSGLTAVPVAVRAAQIGTALRAWQTVSKLGGAVISSLTDLPLRVAAMSYQGRPVAAAWAENVAELGRGRGDGQAREIAAMLDAGIDGIRNQITGAAVADDLPMGKVHRIVSTFFRWQGMTWWQDAMKAGAARSLSRWMGENAGKAYDAIPARYRATLRQHGITAEDWELIRATAFQGDDGSPYVTPDRLAGLPREAIARLARDELDALDTGLARRVAQREARNKAEAEWVQKRTDKWRGQFAAAVERLRRANEASDEAAGRRVAELRERMGLLEVRLSELAEFHQALAEGRAWLDTAPDPAPASTNAALSAEAPATGQPGSRPFAPRAERYLDAADPATLAARAEGELRQRLDALRRAIGNINRANTQADRDRLRDLLSWWNKREAELTAFADQMQARAAERQAATQAEMGEWTGRVERVLDAKRLDLELKLRRFFADEMGFAVLEPDAAARRLTLQGTRPGTVTGEVLRAVAQFKGFPVAFTQRALGRALLGYEPAERLLQARHLGTLIGGLIVLGYASMTAKDVLRGWGPRDPTKLDTILAALLQSGGAGIYGDFLFAQANRFGNSAAETALGPLLGTGFAALNLAAQTRDLEAKPAQYANLVLANTPGASLWYVRPVLDFLILNSLRESLSPGFLARQERNRREDFGQERLIPASVF